MRNKINKAALFFTIVSGIFVLLLFLIYAFYKDDVEFIPWLISVIVMCPFFLLCLISCFFDTPEKKVKYKDISHLSEIDQDKYVQDQVEYLQAVQNIRQGVVKTTHTIGFIQTLFQTILMIGLGSVLFFLPFTNKSTGDDAILNYVFFCGFGLIMFMVGANQFLVFIELLFNRKK